MQTFVGKSHLPKEWMFVTKSHPQLNHSRSLGRNDDRAAGRIPATLPKELCGPVKIRFIYVPKKHPWYETLTRMLRVLRCEADETGYAEGKSVRQVLMSIDGVTGSVAKRAMDDLRGLGLYATEMTGYQVSSYQLDTKHTVVTKEMVRDLRRTRRVKKTERTQPVGNDESVESPAVSSHDSGDADLLAQAADTIEMLETKVNELTRALSDRTRDLEAAQAQVLELKAESESARASTASRERLAAVLNRRTKSSVS